MAGAEALVLQTVRVTDFFQEVLVAVEQVEVMHLLTEFRDSLLILERTA
jgi:hypothetical protein